MKKFTGILLALILALSFAACGDDTAPEGGASTSGTAESAASSSADSNADGWIADDENEFVTKLKTYFEEPTMIIMHSSYKAVLSSKERIYLADKTVEFLTALTDNYDAVIDSTLIDNEHREAMRSCFESRNINAISQIIIGVNGYIENADFTLIPYVFFDDSEHKYDTYVGFSKTKNGEYVICGLGNESYV